MADDSTHPRPAMDAEPLTVGRLMQLLSEFYDATPVWLTDINLLHHVQVDAKVTGAGYGVVLHKGERVVW